MSVNSNSILPNFHIKPTVPKCTKPEGNGIDWGIIALMNKEVGMLINAGFSWRTNWGDPDQITNHVKAKKTRQELDEYLEKLKVDFGPEGVCVIKSVYDTNGRPYKGAVAIWVCDVKPDLIIKELPSKPTEKLPLLF